jgi:hypothetical protein
MALCAIVARNVASMGFVLRLRPIAGRDKYGANQRSQYKKTLQALYNPSNRAP